MIFPLLPSRSHLIDNAIQTNYTLLQFVFSSSFTFSFPCGSLLDIIDLIDISVYLNRGLYKQTGGVLYLLVRSRTTCVECIGRDDGN